MLERVEHILARIGSPGSFAVHRSVTSKGLSLFVKGVGEIELPVTADAVEDLCAVARKAPHGRGAQTVVDETVRDTWEIDGGRIRVNDHDWAHSLAEEADRVRQGLGLPSRTALAATLDKMLIYTPGQFFVPHQDSEKEDGMIGTLLVVLPSSYTGGTLRIVHGGKVRQFKASKRTKTHVTFVAFYADCRHEVAPVESGHRVVLSYNLVARSETARSLSTESLEPGALEAEVERYFATPTPAWSHSKQAVLPDRLVYLLEHEYTKKGISWEHLKNGDLPRAEALRRAAELTDCGIALALADIRQIWECQWEGYGRRSRYASGRGGGTRELDYVIDTEISLLQAVEPGGQPVKGHEVIRVNEVCETRATATMEPYRSEYEPYMGNYGNTEDRWYHRGAIVLWPRGREFVIRAKSSSIWAINELDALQRRGEIEVARSKAAEIVGIFDPAEDPKLFGRTLDVAAALADPELASSLLGGFTLAELKPAHAGPLATLIEAYGLEWVERRVEGWQSGRFRGELVLVRELARLSEALHETELEDAVIIAADLVDRNWTGLRGKITTVIEYSSPSRVAEALKSLFGQILDVLESRVFAFPETNESIDQFWAEHSLPPLVSVDLIEMATRRYSPEVIEQLGLGPLIGRCRMELEEALAVPERREGDWSISVRFRCTCALCVELADFLADPNRQEWLWPLAKEKRRHVHEVLDRYELPVTHETVRTGSPHKLELIKTRALFKQGRERRAACATGLEAVGKYELRYSR